MYDVNTSLSSFYRQMRWDFAPLTSPHCSFLAVPAWASFHAFEPFLNLLLNCRRLKTSVGQLQVRRLQSSKGLPLYKFLNNILTLAPCQYVLMLNSARMLILGTTSWKHPLGVVKSLRSFCYAASGNRLPFISYCTHVAFIRVEV